MSIQQLANLPVLDLSGGMVSNISDNLLPTTVSKQSINFHYDLLGAATQRYGTTVLGAVVETSQTCTGMHQYINNAGSVNQLLAVFNKNIYSYNGSSWSNTGAVTTTAKVRFASFLDYVFRVGGGAATMTWNGGSWGSNLVSGCPDSKFITTYKEKVYVAGTTDNPDRIYFSSVPTTGRTITWTTTDWIDVNPDDSDNITGLYTASDLLLIFKENSFYTYNNSSVANVSGIGTPSQESVADCKGYVFFFNPAGVFVTNGGFPKEISRPVYDWIAGMSASFYGDVSGFCDDDHYFCSIGDVTKGGRTYSNVWLVYTISSQVWTVFSFADSFRFMRRYEVPTTGAISYVGGDTDGTVQTFFSGNTDNGTAINFEYVSKEHDGDSTATTKSLGELAVYMINGTGAQIMVQTDSGKDFETIGEINDTVTILKGLNCRGHFVKFKLTGANSSTPVVLEGYEILNWQSLGLLTRN